MLPSNRWVRSLSLSSALLLWIVAGCSSGTSGSVDGAPSGNGSSSATDPCGGGADLAGYVHTVAHSRFAFGGTPIESKEGSIERWTGPDGVFALEANGNATAILNGGAPEQSAAPFGDADAHNAHVVSYFTGAGMPTCEVGAVQALGGSSSGGGSVVSTSITRTIDGIAIDESIAYASFIATDQTTLEGVYWPVLPQAVVADARSWRDALSDAANLAAYRATLPSDAQGSGRVVLHHTPMYSTLAFQAVATFDVDPAPPASDDTRSFDRSGHRVTLPQ